jgi:ribosomal protein S6
MSEENNERFYEVGYLLLPTTAETEVEKEVTILKSAIETAGGALHSDAYPEYIDLAYTMEKTVGSKKSKYSQGYFGWIKFTIDPSAVAVLTKALDGNLALIRYILIKTNVDNTIVFKKPKIDAKRETVLSEEEMDALIAATEAESADVEVKEEHEKLPDLAADIAPDPIASTEA